MNTQEISGWLGEYEVWTRPKGGIWTYEGKLKNRIMNAGLNMLRDGLKGDISDMELKYLAVGTDDTANTDTMTTLGAEGFRSQFTNKQTAGTGILQSTALILDTEAVINIREVGIFAGVAATSSVDTGILVSRILYTKDKTNLESIQFVRTDTIARGG